MKKLVVLFSLLLLISSAKAGDKNKYFEASLFSVGEKFYPRVILEDQQNFIPTSTFTSPSTMGLWAMAEYSNLPYTPDSWKNKGYNLGTNYDLDVKMGLTCDLPFEIPFIQFIIGVDYSSNKKSFGPMAGLIIEARKFYFQAIFVDSWTSAYGSKELSQKEIDYWRSKGCVGDPSYIRGFDPNSWYRIKFLYALSDNIDIGVVGERFYGTCLDAEYKLSKLFKFKFMFGHDFEFSKDVFCFGLLFNLNK